MSVGITKWITYGSVPGSSTGTSLTTSATADTFGSWVEITAATDFDSTMMMVCVSNAFNGSGSRHQTYEIGIGSGGSEVTVVAGLHSSRWQNEEVYHYVIPIFIPAGTRVAARAKCSTSAANTCQIVIYMGHGELETTPVHGYYTNIGSASGSDPGYGVNIDPGATAHTKSAWYEVVSSTPREINYLITQMSLDVSSKNFADIGVLWDLAVGAASSEVVVLENIPSAKHGLATDEAKDPITGWFLNIPAGSRVAVRAQSRNTTLTERELHFHMIGF